MTSWTNVPLVSFCFPRVEMADRTKVSTSYTVSEGGLRDIFVEIPIGYRVCRIK